MLYFFLLTVWSVLFIVSYFEGYFLDQFFYGVLYIFLEFWAVGLLTYFNCGGVSPLIKDFSDNYLKFYRRLFLAIFVIGLLGYSLILLIMYRSRGEDLLRSFGDLSTRVGVFELPILCGLFCLDLFYKFSHYSRGSYSCLLLTNFLFWLYLK